MIEDTLARDAIRELAGHVETLAAEVTKVNATLKLISIFIDSATQVHNSQNDRLAALELDRDAHTRRFRSIEGDIAILADRIGGT